MAEQKRDYYEVLGVDKMPMTPLSKRHIVLLPRNIIRI